MNIRQIFLDMAIIALITFVVASIVTSLYSLISTGVGQVSWETAFQLAIVLGIVLPLTRARNNRAS